MSAVKSIGHGRAAADLEELAVVVDAVLASRYRETVQQQQKEIDQLTFKVSHLTEMVEIKEKTIGFMQQTIDFYVGLEKSPHQNHDELINPTDEELEAITTPALDMKARRLARLTFLNLVLSLVTMSACAVLLYNLI